MKKKNNKFAQKSKKRQQDLAKALRENLVRRNHQVK